MSLGPHRALVVVAESMMPRNFADGAECVGADLPSPFGNCVCHGKDLFSLFVEQKIVVAEMAAVHVPVRILGLEVERKYIGQKASQLFPDLIDPFGLQGS